MRRPDITCPFFTPRTIKEEAFYELLLREIEDGMYLGGHYSLPVYQTDIRPGLIKAAITDEGVSGRAEELLRAAGQAAVDGNLSLMLHTEYGKGALDAIQMLTNLGLETEKILICHVDRQTEDYRIHEEIAATGVFLEYDTITLTEFHSIVDEVKLLEHMAAKGYWDQILLSTDPTKDRLKSYGGNMGIDYLLTSFFGELVSYGFCKEMIKAVAEVNPARALSRESKSCGTKEV